MNDVASLVSELTYLIDSQECHFNLIMVIILDNLYEQQKGG